MLVVFVVVKRNLVTSVPALYLEAGRGRNLEERRS
jgi:hypothetical protein